MSLRTIAALATLTLGAGAQELFDAPVYLPEATGGEFRAHGDFDGDGDDDLLHMTGWLSWSGMTVFLNDGSGHFSAGNEVVFTPGSGTSIAQWDPALGDFDGDGNLDVSVDHSGFLGPVRGVEVFFGDGAGGFGGSLFMDLQNGITEQFAGNVDADPAQELAVKWRDSGSQTYWAWLDWNGSSFSMSASIPVGGAADPEGAFVSAVGDFNDDGDDDIASTSLSFTLLRVFPTVAGAPTYGHSYSIPAPMQDINHRIRAADLDGDGDDDLVHLKMTSTDPGPWVQTYSNTGAGLLQHAAENVPAPSTGWMQPHYLRLGDWDGDGWVDLMSNNFVLDVFRSDGDFTFSEGFEAASTGQTPGGGPFDADGDGMLDYAATRTILFGDQSFDDPDAVGGVQTFDYYDGFYPVDYEGDGDVDLMGAIGGRRHVNDATGAFNYVSGALFGDLFPAPPPGGYFYRDIVAFDDFDGDGRRDYLVELCFDFGTSVGFVEMRSLIEAPLGDYVDPGLPAALALVQIAPPSGEYGYWDTGDADGDGDIDVLVEDGFWANNAAGLFDTFVPAYQGRGRATADVDLDGDMDIAVTRDMGAVTGLYLYKSTPAGFFATSLGSVPGDAAAILRDLDDDGDVDLLAADPEGEDLHLFENQGGVFHSAGSVLASVTELRLVGVHDADGDGKPDLYTARGESDGFPWSIPLLSVRRLVGPGLAYEDHEEYLLTGDCEGFLDVDSDGDLDAIGSVLLRGTQIELPDGGMIRQFGEGFPGTAGVIPVIGASGPPVSSSTSAELRVTKAVGGGTCWVVFGNQEVALRNVPFSGMTLYVGDPTIVPNIPLSGAPGEPGAGEASIPLPKLPALFGLSFAHQAFVLDLGSTTLWSASNGMEILYGP